MSERRKSPLARWALAFRLARREARRHPWRHGLVVLMILVPVLAAFAAFSGIATAQRLEARKYRFENAGRVASIRVDPNRERPDGPEVEPADLTPLIEKLPRGSVVETGWDGADWLVTTDQLPDDRGPRLVGTQVAEAANGSHHAARYVVAHGRLPRSSTEMFLSEQVARLGPWKIGDTVESARSRQRFDIVGIGSAGDNVRRRVAVVADQPDSFWSAPSGNVGTVRVSDGDQGDMANTQSWRDVGIWASSPTSDGQQDAIERAMDGYTAGGGFRSFDRVSMAGNLSAGTSGGLVLLVTGLAAMVAVVTSAAFAIASRRQLRGIGLLATAGADPATIRAALVLQGAIPGLIAGASAIAIGFVVRPWLQDWLPSATDVSGAEVVLSVGGGVLAVVLGIGAGIGAAWMPARTASRIPLLSALAGRRPLGPVPTRVPVRGLVAVAAGLVGIAFVTRRASTIDAASREAGLMPLLSIAAILAVIFGLLATAPTLVSLLGRVAGRATGTTRLALRGLARHRTQSTATVAAVAICLALPVAFLSARSAAADVERARSDGYAEGATATIPSDPIPESGVVDLRQNPDGLVAEVHGDLASAAAGSVVANAEKAIGPTGNTLSVVAFTNGTGGWNAVASIDPAAADQLLLPWAAVQIKAGGAIALRGKPGPLTVDDGARSISVDAIGAPGTNGPGAARIDGLEADYLVAATALSEVGKGRPPIQLVALRSKPATRAEESELMSSDGPGYDRFNGCCPNPTLAEIRTPVEGSSPTPQPTIQPSVWVEVVSRDADAAPPTILRRRDPTVDRLFLALAGGSTALALLILTITLSLRAVDSQDDHRAAVAVGAPPARMRRQQALEGMVLAGLGAVLAAPLGWLPVIAFRFGSIRELPRRMIASDSWVDAVTQRLHFPGWQVVPVLVAPALIAGLLWLIVPAVRAALIRRPQDEVMQGA